MTSTIPLEDVIGAGEAILSGKLRGRTVVRIA
jgi:hypothetical protein